MIKLKPSDYCSKPGFTMEDVYRDIGNQYKDYKRYVKQIERKIAKWNVPSQYLK